MNLINEWKQENKKKIAKTRKYGDTITCPFFRQVLEAETNKEEIEVQMEVRERELREVKEKKMTWKKEMKEVLVNKRN